MNWKTWGKEKSRGGPEKGQILPRLWACAGRGWQCQRGEWREEEAWEEEDGSKVLHFRLLAKMEA